MSDPILRIEHLSKVYEDGTRALSDVSFEVARGEFLVIIGLSGSGKSTLLRCINRLVTPTSGRVWVDGRDVTAASRDGLREIRRGIGMVFQQFNLVRRASVLTNVLAGRLGYVPPAWSLGNYFPGPVVDRAMQSLERVGIADKAFGRASALSGGQQQRVGIARALMQEPRIILADEPVASLDPALSHSILKYLEDLNRKDGITILCSLHFLSLARRYGTRILALKDGAIVFDGRPGDIDEARFRAIYGEQAEEVEIT
ncbi:MAG TPA: phosphonate ABC transporter ATP-binding protein [bacterium]|nr:phosphonate ABC transporter ATP-binding protein [bacterium]